ncbi:MAG TPA: tetratricopeptide repeat protein [Phycisphaerae bacterium]|nr:tetratricopeptide repeat protein [Phycisphaerae bacterium]
MKNIIGIFVLIVLCFAAYWPLHGAGFIWDDDLWLTNNDIVHHWSGLWDIWLVPESSVQYYPLTSTFFLLEYKIWALAAEPYHLLNIALQILNAILLWRLLYVLKLRSAWLAAVIFAIHPMQVDTVGWVVEQKNLISGALYFCAALSWLRFRDFDSGTSSVQTIAPRPLWRFYILATVLFLLAILAKSFVCTLPAALLIIAWWKTGYILRRDILPLVPWFLAALLIAPLTNAMERATGTAFEFSFAQHMIIMGKDLWFYVLKFIWPHPLLEIYSRWDTAHFSMMDWIYPVAALAAPVVLWSMRDKIGRGPAAAVAYYMVTLSPALGFLAFYGSTMTFVADHYFYLPIIGLTLLVVEPFVRLLNRITQQRTAAAIQFNKGFHPTGRTVVATTVFSVVLLIPLGITTYAQSSIYSPPVGIWLNVIKYNPACWIAPEQAGAYYYGIGDDKNAYIYFRNAYDMTDGHEPSVDVNLGDLYSDQFNRNPTIAVNYYSQALEDDPYQPGVIVKLVHCYEVLGNLQQAAVDLQKGLKEYPKSATLHFEWGYLLWIGGYYADAAEEFKQVIEYEPDNVLGMYNLALLMEHLNKTREAQDYYQRALELSPNFGLGHYDYGRFLLARGQANEAVEELQKAITVAQEEKVPVLEAKALVVQAQAYDALKLTAEAMQERTMIQRLGFPVPTKPMPISPLLRNP